MKSKAPKGICPVILRALQFPEIRVNFDHRIMRILQKTTKNHLFCISCQF